MAIHRRTHILKQQCRCFCSDSEHHTTTRSTGSRGNSFEFILFKNQETEKLNSNAIFFCFFFFWCIKSTMRIIHRQLTQVIYFHLGVMPHARPICHPARISKHLGEFVAINSEFMGHNPQNLFARLILLYCKKKRMPKTNARTNCRTHQRHDEKLDDEKLTQTSYCEVECFWWSARCTHAISIK